MKKKIISVLLCIIMLFSTVSVCFMSSAADSTGKLSIAVGIKKLRKQFKYGMSSSGMDYDYFSPVTDENDTKKYPLVVWVHGFFSGAVPGLQVNNNDIAYWTSSEFQSRFRNGGAYIICPRSKESVDIWTDNMTDDMKACIDFFLAKNSDNIDTTRIYIGGLSTGAKMVYKMLAAYPDMFAAAFPCSPSIETNITNTEASKMKNIPIWLLASEWDDRSSYTLQLASWKKIVSYSERKSDCRISVFDGLFMYYPDGKIVDHVHDTWYAATYDMFTTKNEQYYHMTVTNGLGEKIQLEYPNGMIYWLSQYRSNYKGTTVSNTISLYTAVLTIIYSVLHAFVITLGIDGIA